MNVGSLFSGIGGFDLGFDRAGMRTVWFCESEPFCQRVLAHHWPGVPCYPDVAQLRADDVAPIDVLCGGFPCQDLSVAGKGAGIDGARSGLWSQFARLVGELRPRYVVVENVPALLGRGAGRVLGDLAACGYDAEWDCLPASAFGAPHQRDRFWLVAYPNGSRGAEQRRECKEVGWPQQPDGAGFGGTLGRDVADSYGAGREARGSDRVGAVAPAGSGQSPCSGSATPDPNGNGCSEGLCEPTRGDERPGEADALRGREHELQDPDERALQPWRVGGRAAQAGGPEWWSVEPPVGRVAHGVPDRLDQLAALGNALVPQIAEWIGQRIVSHEQRQSA